MDRYSKIIEIFMSLGIPHIYKISDTLQLHGITTPSIFYEFYIALYDKHINILDINHNNVITSTVLYIQGSLFMPKKQEVGHSRNSFHIWNMDIDLGFLQQGRRNHCAKPLTTHRRTLVMYSGQLAGKRTRKKPHMISTTPANFIPSNFTPYHLMSRTEMESQKSA